MIKTRNNLEFKRIQALNVLQWVYPRLALKLRQDDRPNIALAIGYRLVEKLGQ